MDNNIDYYENGQFDTYEEILDMLTSGDWGGRTEAYEGTVKHLRKRIEELA